MRFAIPLCGSFFLRCAPLWSYGTKSGFAEKQFFKLRFFFRTCLDSFQSTQNPNMWIDVGTWNIVFPNNLKKTEALQKNNFSSSEMFFRTCLDCFQSDLEHCLPNNSVKRATPTQASHPDGPLHQENDILTDPLRCLKSHSPGVEPPPWRRWPLRYRSLAFNEFCFLILSLFALAAKGWV